MRGRSQPLGEASYVELVPHNPLSAVLTAACVHFCAATHNIAFQELGGIEQGTDQVDRPVPFKDGYLELPKGPGLGIDLNLEALKRYPPRSFNRRPVFTSDGALRDY
jgi:galactonate dehydratase